MNKKTQSFMVVFIILVILMVVIFITGAIIIKSIKKDNTTMVNNSDAYNINQSILPGDSQAVKAEMAKNKTISPPELTG